MTKTEMKTKMMSILNDTIAFYSKNTKRRGMNPDAVCTFRSDKGHRCAVGRYLSNSDLTRIDINCNGLMTSMDSAWPHILTKRVKELPQVFWENLQQFHDDDDNWDETTITKEGLRSGREIEVWIRKGKW